MKKPRVPTILAWACVTLLGMSLAAILVGSFLVSDGNHDLIAALLATNAGTALVVAFTFNVPQLSEYTSDNSKILIGFIALVSGLFSALQWMEDAVVDPGLRVIFIVFVLLILFVLLGFICAAKREKKKLDNE